MKSARVTVLLNLCAAIAASCVLIILADYAQKPEVIINNYGMSLSRIIKVEVRVISRSRRLRLMTFPETLIILDIRKTESNNCFIIH